MRWRAFVALAGSSGLMVAWPWVVQAREDVQQLAEQAIRRLDLQTSLPSPRDPWLKINLPSIPAEALWLLIIVAVGVLLYSFRDAIAQLAFGQGSAWLKDEAGSDASAQRTSMVVLEAADDLAARGQFVEAMHALLLQSLAEVRRRLDVQFADSLTSREIVQSARLSQTGRASLRDIVARVEWTYFGGRPAARPDYDGCRQSFVALAQALQQGAPA
jgi:hypothetical protein